MTLKTTPHLNFRGQARAALEFYHRVFGGHLTAVTYRDMGADSSSAEADQIMWGKVETESGFRLMAYDVPVRLNYAPGEIPFFVSLSVTEADALKALWDGLLAGATIIQPIGPAAWTPLSGMLKDQFGVTWVVDQEVPYSG